MYERLLLYADLKVLRIRLLSEPVCIIVLTLGVARRSCEDARMDRQVSRYLCNQTMRSNYPT